MKMHLQLLFQNQGAKIANLEAAVQAVTHLYNAVKMENPAFPVWEDIESLISFRGEQAIFVGTRPTNPKDYFKRYSMAIGISATAFAAKRRRVKARSIHPKEVVGRYLAARGAIADIYWDRLCVSKEGNGAVTASKLEKVFKESTREGMLGSFSIIATPSLLFHLGAQQLF
jgi:hypothetical protein